MNLRINSSIQKLVGKRSAAVAMAVVLVAALGGVAAAVTVGGGNGLGFEIEGDFVDSPSGGPKDWMTVTPVMVTDDTADSGFTEGSKELKPSGWSCGNGGAEPNKGNILRAYAHTRISAAGAFVDLAWVAQNISGEGDVHLNFEFSQDGTAQDPDDFDGSPTVDCSIPRQADDLLVTYDFPGGSANPQIKLFKWAPLANPNGNADGTWIDLNLTDAAADAAVNASQLDDPFDGSINPQRFGEATIDLLAALPEGALSGCQDFGYLNVRSRSSGESESSSIQDKLPTTAIDLNTCGKVIVHKVDDHVPPQALAGAVFGLYTNANATGAPVQQQSSGGNGTATFENVEPGNYWVKEISAPVGYTPDPDVVAVTVGFRQTVDVAQAFVNPRDVGTVRIVKKLTDENGDPIIPDEVSDLDGASFTVFKDANNDGTYQAGEAAQLWPNETTDATCTIGGGAGFCDVGPLPTGTYGVHETVPPAGTTAGADVHPVVVAKNTTVTVNFVNSLSPLNIAIDKSGPDEAHRGGTITYTFKASTSGPKLHDVVIEELATDRCDGAMTGPVKNPGNQDGFLETGEIWTYSCTHVVTADDPDPLPNEAKVTGTDDFGRDVSDADTHSVDILDPAITLDKKVEDGDHKPVTNAYQAHVGETLHYTITITNTGDTSLTISALSDNVKANLPASCTAGVGSTLAPNATITCAYTLTAPTTDVHNTATVTGVDNLGGTAGTKTATDETFVDVIHPHLTIVKDGTKTAHEGDATHYTFDVTNDGDVALENVSVDDDKLGRIGTITTLAVNQTVRLTADSIAPAGDLTNVATACGADPLESQVCDDDDHTLDVIDPSIKIVKTGTTQAHEGDATSYSFAVTNDGDVVLTDVSVDDDKLGHIGDIPLLEVDQTVTLSKASTAPANDVRNVAEACGDDPLDEPVCEDDDHTLDIAHPGINVEKSAATKAHEGDVVTYTFVVTNTGDALLAPVTVVDDVLGPIGTIPTLGAGASTTLTKEFTVPASTDDVDNVVEACGIGPVGTTEFCDTDIHHLDVIHPAVTLDKKVNGGDHKPVGSALPTHVGEELRYTIVISNTGDTALTITELEDTVEAELPNDCTLGIGGVLEPGNSITCTYKQIAPDEDVHNVASVAGVDEVGGAKGSASASDETFVDVLHPAIEVVKDGPALAHEGDTVTYTFKVANIGDVALTNVAVTDDVIGDIGTIDVLAVDQAVTLSKDYEVPADTDGITNTATACGDDPAELEVCDTDEHSLVVIHPSVEIIKPADPITGGPRAVVLAQVEERPELPRTGLALRVWLLVSGLLLGLGAAALNLELTRRRTVDGA